MLPLDMKYAMDHGNFETLFSILSWMSVTAMLMFGVLLLFIALSLIFYAISRIFANITNKRMEPFEEKYTMQGLSPKYQDFKKQRSEK